MKKKKNKEKKIKKGYNMDLLSEREVEVIKVILQGVTITKAALSLNIAEGTVRKHLNNIYIKLKVSNRVELQIKTSEMGIT